MWKLFLQIHKISSKNRLLKSTLGTTLAHNFWCFKFLYQFSAAYTRILFIPYFLAISFCLGEILSIYKFGLSVCLFVSNKRQNGWTDRAQFFCGTSRDHREDLWMIKFLKFLKIREIFCENPLIIFVLFYDVHKENMFTIIFKYSNFQIFKYLSPSKLDRH